MSIQTSYLDFQAREASELTFERMASVKSARNTLAGEPAFPPGTLREPRRTRDITIDLAKAASRRLVKDDNFTLFEAVGALEIMDPKMDSGVLSAEDSLDEDYDIERVLSAEEAIGIMDSMLSSEVAWQTGHPLSQTLFTSLYVDHLLRPEAKISSDAKISRHENAISENPMLHLVLQAYFVLTIKACGLVHKQITQEGYYEEEDFVTNLYNRTLLPDIDSEAVHKMGEEAIQYLEGQPDLGSDLCHALVNRLRYRQAFLKATSIKLEKYRTEGPKAWNQCLYYIPKLEETYKLGIEVPESFSVKVQRRLMSSVPPRPIVHVGFSAAIRFLAQLSGDGVQSANVLICSGISNTINFLRVFCSRKPPTSLYIRCLIQSLVFEQTRKKGKFAERELVFKELSEFVLPFSILLDTSNANVETPNDHRYHIWRKMDKCSSQLFDAFHDLVRALCMNRSRTRRMLCHLIGDWDNLQLDLEELDSELRAYTNERPVFEGIDAWELPLSSWSYMMKLRQMEWTIQLGFELNIYHIDEWAGMFQYMYDVAEVRQKHISRIYGYIFHHRQTESHLLSDFMLINFDHTMAVLEFAAEEAAATSELSGAFACLYRALGLLGLLPESPARPYSSDSFRHAIRLRPFLQICIPQLESASEPFDEIEDFVDILSTPCVPALATLERPALKAVVLLDCTNTKSRAARKSLDLVSKAAPEVAMCVGSEKQWRNVVKDTIRAAVTASVFAAKVKKWATDGLSKENIKLNFNDGESTEVLGTMAACWKVPVVVVT